MILISSLILAMFVKSLVLLLFRTSRPHLPLVISVRVSMSVSVNFLTGSFVIFGSFGLLGAPMISDETGFLISIFGSVAAWCN